MRIGRLAIGYDLGRKGGGDCRLRLRALMWFVGSIITSKQRKKQRFNKLVERKNEQIRNLPRCCEQKNAL